MKFNPIWLVEDSVDDIELTVTALEESNLANRLIVIRDGSEALERLKTLGYPGGEPFPAVILLDIKMPKVDGIDVLRTIKSDPRLKNLPVVVLTSSRESPDVNTCYELGANAYVVKPMEFGDFFDALKILGKFWAILNEWPEPKMSKG